MQRTHTCGALNTQHVGSEVRLAGWVHRVRDHGGLVFVDLRDRFGITQVVFDADEAAAAFEAAGELAAEWVIQVVGRVRARPAGQENPHMATGDIEVVAQTMTVLSASQVPPFEVARDDVEPDERLRLRYRYLDLRRTRMQRNLKLRHDAARYVREYLNGRDFLEVETPILIKSTPEGARDFLVPSRVHAGRFYALPQSPQQLKQLLMVAGVDRYYQLARCFRDEDLRADRQLEFTQLDIEMSFVDEEDIMELTEGMMLGLAREVAPGMHVQRAPIPRIEFADAMARFGTDKPDLRYGLEIADISAEVAGSEFRVFAKTVADGGVVRAIAIDRIFSRREIDELEELARTHGAAGLAWLAYEGEDARGSVAKFLSDAEKDAIRNRSGAESEATVFIVAGDAKMVAIVLGRLRVELARRLDLVQPGELALCWIVDPPLFEWNEDEERWDPAHHPFTAPQERDLEKLETDPGAVRARAYDLVGNGYELGGGSIRIHDRAIQEHVFSAIGISIEDIRGQFGHLLEALDLGAPPHGGIAPGFDRVVMVLAEEDSIREVIPFPKTLSGVDPMTGSPSAASEAALAELHLAVTEE